MQSTEKDDKEEKHNDVYQLLLKEIADFLKKKSWGLSLAFATRLTGMLINDQTLLEPIDLHFS